MIEENSNSPKGKVNTFFEGNLSNGVFELGAPVEPFDAPLSPEVVQKVDAAVALGQEKEAFQREIEQGADHGVRKTPAWATSRRCP